MAENHLSRFNQLANQMDELGLQSEAEARAAEEKAAAVRAEFAEGLIRVEAALEQVEALLIGGGDYGDRE
jgi:autophagy-related protein 11